MSKMIQEAFRAFEALNESEEFNLSSSGIDELSSFLDMAGEDPDIEAEIIDLEAEAKEDLKDSYIGKIIVNCDVCHSNIFVNAEDVIINEEGIVEIAEEGCPYCMSNDGFTIIGEVKPYSETLEDEEAEAEEEIEELEDEISEEEAESEELEDEGDSLEDLLADDEEENLDEALKLDKVEEMAKDDELNGKLGLGRDEDLEGSDELRGEKYTELNEGFKVTSSVEADGTIFDSDLENAKEEAEATVRQLISDDKKKNSRKGQVKYFINGVEFDGENYIEAEEAEEKLSNDELRKKVLTDKGFPSYAEMVDTDPENEKLQKLLATFKLTDADLNESLNEDINGSIIIGSVEDELDGWKSDVRIISTNEGYYWEDDVEHSEKAFETFEDAAKDYAANLYNGSRQDVDNCRIFFIDEYKYLDYLNESCNNKINEDIKDVSITTEDETMTMTTKEDGGVEIETTPIVEEETENEVEIKPEDEVIAPIEDEIVDGIEDINTEEEESEEETPEEDLTLDDIEEFDEESFDNLGESYLKRCYENVNSFKTTKVDMEGNKLIVEGNIGFASGNTKATKFMFESAHISNGTIKFHGCNENITRGKKAFKLNCSVNDKNIICESLNYNYKSKNDLNESVRVYGTVRKAK